MRTFLYTRVSTAELTTENQVVQARNAGYDIPEHRVVSETVSGTVPASQRTEFNKLIEKLEHGDTLVVTKLDRLGRDNIDIQNTVAGIIKANIILRVLDLPDEIGSSSGLLMMQIFAVFAEFERNRISERTIAGQKRALAQGKKVGRPVAYKTRQTVADCRAAGLTQAKAAAETGLSLSTIAKYWNFKHKG